MPATDRRYVVLGLYYAEQPDKVQLLGIEGKIITFDTVAVAQQFVPRLGGGRLDAWDTAGESCWFTPLVRQGFNRVDILTGYDPYDVPNGARSAGIWSEAEGRDWRYHVHWCDIWRELMAWADRQGESHGL